MTEKEFLDRFFLARGPEANPYPQRALALAKEAGAKFDPEPVELPVLGTRATNLDGRPLYYPAGAAGCLTQDQVAEVVRRCNAWLAIGGEIRRRGEGLVSGQCDPDAIGKALLALARMEFKL